MNKRDELTEIKALLRGAFRAQQLYNAHLECLYKLRMSADGVEAMDYSRVRVSGGASGSSLEDAALRIVSYEKLVAQSLDQLRCSFEIAHQVIMNVQSPALQLLLVKRYLSFENWERIACDMKYSWRQVHRLHRRALMAAKAALKIKKMT